jgi:RNA polymerase sigma-70 factor (ECF subfamily)
LSLPSVSCTVEGISERGEQVSSDQDLVEQIRERDAHAFEQLFERYREMIRRHLMHIVRDEAIAQDLVQEVFLRVWTHVEQWNGQGPFKAWLYRIATNQALNSLRSMRRRREQPLDVPEEWADEEGGLIPAWLVDVSALGPDATLELREQREQIRQLIDRLPEDKREAFRLVHQMEMSIRDAADELGVPEGTVKSRLHYAKNRLASQWQDLETHWEEI